MTNRYKFRSLWQYSPPDIVNPLSVSVQASGKKRLILNLRHNNFHTFKQKFKCEGLHTTIIRLNVVRIQIYTRYCGKLKSKLWKHAFEVTYNYFPCHSLTEQMYSYINHRLKWIILSVRSLNVFWRKNCRDSHWTWIREWVATSIRFS